MNNKNNNNRLHYIKLGIYQDAFNINQLSDSEKEEYKKNGFFEQIPLKNLQWLHYLTLGLSTTFWYGMQYSKLPKIQDDDFDSIKAIGFAFIPIFNIFWLFIFWDKFLKRINFQLKIRGEEEIKQNLKYLGNNITLMIPIFTIASVIPILGIATALLNYFILMPTILKETHSAIEKLAQENINNIQG